MGAEQLSLFGHDDTPRVLGFQRLQRHQLDAQSFIDYAPEFLGGHEPLFQQLRTSLPLRAERRLMYEREVDVPRLYASVPEDAPVPAVLHEIGRVLALRYAVPDAFPRIGVALYRGGDDSVAWHRDHMPRDVQTLVAIVSLGTPRRMLVKPYKGGASRAFMLGWGDLFVMGGLCQTHWQHCIPKQRQAEPRMSCVFRYVYG